MSELFDQLQHEIAASRRAVRGYEEQGYPDLANVAAARLSGLLYAERLFSDGALPCHHPTHTTGGIDEDTGRTIWLCTLCRERAT